MATVKCLTIGYLCLFGVQYIIGREFLKFKFVRERTVLINYFILCFVAKFLCWMEFIV